MPKAKPSRSRHSLSGRELAARLRRTALVVFDFDGVFTDNTVTVSETGAESVTCWRSDGLGLARLRAAGVKAWIVSTDVNPVVTARARKLGLPCRQGCTDKLATLAELLDDEGLSLEETAYVGNDINDESCLRAVGLPIVVADAHADVADLGLYRTRAPGGRGAVREVCELIVGARAALGMSRRSRR